MQTINRNNYEEFFLLYVDNELDTASKLAVENFVLQHPDLAVELEMFMESRVLPEAMVFADKEMLLRTEGESISEKNYEEFFLLYIDNELSAAKRAEVERYVLQHPALQDEFTTLKQAVLAPETVSYGNKEVLYRTEKRRVVYFRTWQIAAAAIFIGACLTGWWMMQQPSAGDAVASVSEAVKQEVPVTKLTENNQQNKLAGNEEQVTQPLEEQQPAIASQEKSTVKKQKNNTAVSIAEKNKETEPLTVIPVIKQEEAPQIAVVQRPPLVHKQLVDPKEPPVQTPGVALAQDNVQQQNDVAALQASGKAENNAHKVYPVAYKELNTNTDDNSLHVGMFDLNKTKVTTLFKKAGRVFNKKSNNLSDEDGKLQVAGFEIDTKN